MSLPLPKVYVGIDWLSLTTSADEDAQTAYARCRALAVEQQDAGDRLQPWASHGYRGFGLPHLRCGVRDGDTLVELSGALADHYWREFLPLAHRITRLDTQVTCTFDYDVRDLALNAFDAPAVTFRPGLPPIRKDLHREKDGGQTCYLGAPASARRGRLYDKHAESSGEWPANSWRWELQERAPFSGVTASRVDGSDNVPGAVSAVVCGFFRAHGVEPWFCADNTPLLGTPGRSRRDLSRWLDWLRSGVAPGVRRWGTAANRDAILRALELDGEVPS